MSDCEAFRKLAEEHLEGTLSAAELAELKTHTETCPACREQFQSRLGLEALLRAAFEAETTPAQARQRVLAQLAWPSQVREASMPGPAGWWTWIRGIGSPSPTWLAWASPLTAIALLMASGVGLGFYLGHQWTAEPPEFRAAVVVPIIVKQVEGTVLVRHEGSDMWQALGTNASVRVGDSFHSAARARFVLSLADEGTLEVAQNSMLALQSFNGETQFHLEQGKLVAALRSPHPPFFVSTPHGRVEALGTEFSVTVE